MEENGKGQHLDEENEKGPHCNNVLGLKNEALFISMFICNIFQFSSYSLMGPLFPWVATDKGVNFTIQGLIFASYAFTSIISAPVVKNIMPYMEVKHFFMFGVLFTSIGVISFGFYGFFEDRNTFIICCFASRIMTAFGVVAAKQASFLTVTLTWPDDIAFRLGIMEAAIPIGLMIGPSFAGLAQIVDYYLPFLVNGLLPVLPGAVAAVLMTTPKLDPKQSLSIINLIRIPGVTIMSIVVILCFCSFIMMEPTLSHHLRFYGLPLYLIGFIFLIQPTCYSLASPIVGKICQWIKPKLLLIIIGSYGMALSYVFFGQSALHDSDYQHIWPTLVSLAGAGAFWSFAMIPSYDRFIVYALSAELQISDATVLSAIGSLFWMMMSAGK